MFIYGQLQKRYMARPAHDDALRKLHNDRIYAAGKRGDVDHAGKLRQPIERLCAAYNVEAGFKKLVLRNLPAYFLRTERLTSYGVSTQ